MKKNTKTIHKSVDFIIESHQRCAAYGLEKTRLRPKLLLDGAPLSDLLQKRQLFLEVSSPMLESMYKMVNNEEFLLYLTDAEGCVLQLFGSEKAKKDVIKKGICVGVYLDEHRAGTNSIALSLIYDAAFQVRGTEHYFDIYAPWTGSSAPVHVGGAIEGCVGIIGDEKSGHVHTLALVSAIARSLENHIQNMDVQKQLFDSNMYAFAMMNSLSHGVFAIDMNDNIHWVNDTACRQLNIRRLHLLERPIKELYPDWLKAKKTIIEQLSFDDVEGQFSISGLKDRFVFNAIPITTKEKHILGFILMFRELTRMIKALNKYTGMQAQFVFDDIMTHNKTIKTLVGNAKIIAKSPSTILITGESGTGKEVFAQAIHNASDRADAPFVALNCGAISPTLIESELFGYEEGAFTGAKKGGRPGKFELANGGTLFLDEIGEMPLEMQVRLLRTLQEGSVLRVGSDRSIKLDVRVIAATNKNLNKAVQEGKFRLDLYYRLDVIQLKIPPLRERPEDIEFLLHYFLRQKAEKLKMNVPDLSPALWDKLKIYSFPGNVRELENFAEKAVLFGGNLSIDMYPETSPSNFFVNEKDKGVEPGHPKSLAQTERESIEAALKHTQGNISKTAALLGISRNALYMKLKQYKGGS